MKTILLALNSKFIHSNLAVWNLWAMAKEKFDVKVLDWTINEPIEKIYRETIKEDFNVIGFSTYIWNIELAIKLASMIRAVKKNCFIFFGGPEVSYDSLDFLERNPFIDAVISGEGEECFIELLEALEDKRDLNIDGLFYREGENIHSSQLRIVEDLNKIPSCYQLLEEELYLEGTTLHDYFKNKIIYYESSRGCPFNCSYCLSSTIHSVRYYDIERVRDDLKLLMSSGTKQIKFIDRTFNANREYVKELLQTIVEYDDGKINIHLEMVASIMNDELLDFFSRQRKGLFQFEIGVQSTNPKTLKACGRDEDFALIKDRCLRIKEMNNIKQHLDLIAGLPYEDFKSFEKSFNDVASIGIEELQLGFLKLLKGTRIRSEREKFGFKYMPHPPYEVLESKWISYKEMVILKNIADMLDIYLNSGNFTHSYREIIKNHEPFKHFQALSEYWIKNNYHLINHSLERTFEIYADYLIENDYDSKIISCLRFDFLLKFRASRLPKNIGEGVENYDILHRLYHMREVREKMGLSEKISTKELVKRSDCVEFNPKIFGMRWILFYRDREIIYCDITEELQDIKEDYDV